MRTLLAAALLVAAPLGQAEVYAYVNDHGDYVVTPKVPGKDVAEYAVLTDDGEFLRLIRPGNTEVPVTHWRPWFLPRQPDPFDADEGIYDEREGTVGVEELESDRRRPDADQ